MGTVETVSSSSATEDAPITVMVADDEDDIRVLVRAMLARHGMDVVEEAIDGVEALTAINRLRPPPTPTVLLLDNQMPALSGLEVAASVLERFPGQRIVLFTAHLTADIKAQAKAVGIRACLSKSAIALLPTLIAQLATEG